MQILYVVGLGKGELSTLKIIEDKRFSQVRSCIFHSFPPSLQGFPWPAGLRVISLEETLGEKAGEPLKNLGRAAARYVLNIVENEGPAILCLPGRPWKGEAILKELNLLIDRNKVSLQFVTGDDIWGCAMDYVGEREVKEGYCPGATLIDAHYLEELNDPPRNELIISHPCSRQLISGIKRRLLHFYPPGQEVRVLRFNDQGELFPLQTLPLEKMEEETVFDCWTFLHLPPAPYFSIGDMVHMMEQLRSPQGCPWDRQQDHKSLRPYLLEEAYEVLEAINNEDPWGLCEELGDLLLQVIFHSWLAWEKRDFSLWQVIDGITRKIYRRHPHVFQDEKVSSAHEVRLLWQEIKEKEKGARKGTMFALTPGLPALMKAQKVQKRAADVGFDWPDVNGAVDKLYEEARELVDAYREGQKAKIEEEMGDLFFALVNIARFLRVESELALNLTVDKFIRRFQYIEEQVRNRGGDYSKFSLEELDHWWDQSKLLEKEE